MGGISDEPTPHSIINALGVIIFTFGVSVINSFIGVCTTSILIYKIRGMDDGRLRGSIILALVSFLLPLVLLIGMMIVGVYVSMYQPQRNLLRPELYALVALLGLIFLLPIALQIGSLSTISVGEDHKGLTKTVRNLVIAGLVFNSIILFTFVFAWQKYYQYVNPKLEEEEERRAQKATLAADAAQQRRRQSGATGSGIIK